MVAELKSQEWLPFLAEIADRADEIAMRLFQTKNLHVTEKVDRSPVSEADQAIEEVARQLAVKREIGVYGEEYGEMVGKEDVRLFIDPIDATRNFVRGIPIFATLLAIEAKGDIIAGMVSAPALRLRWHAAMGAGAYCGNRQLRVSAIKQLEHAQFFHAAFGGQAEPLPTTLSASSVCSLMQRVERTRGFGDFYQHVLVAEGAGEIALDPVVKPWDIAPLQIILGEAGGMATTLGGEKSIYGGSLVTTNGYLHDVTLDILNGE